MKDLSKTTLSILSWPFALLLLAFTGFQTYTLIHAVTGSHLMAVVGLVLFEAGMLYWWGVFRTEAEGLPQMALSLLVFLLCLIFVALATALKLGAVGEDIMGADTPAKIITAAAVVQLAAKLFFPLIHPDVWRAIKDKVQEGKLINNAETRFEQRADALADRISEEMAEEWERRLITKINTKYQIGYGTVIDSQTEDVPTVAVIGNTTHDAPRHDPPAVPVAYPMDPGQGERPNGPPHKPVDKPRDFR